MSDFEEAVKAVETEEQYEQAPDDVKEALRPSEVLLDEDSAPEVAAVLGDEDDEQTA